MHANNHSSFCAANICGDDADEERDGPAGDGHQEVHRRRPLLAHPRRHRRPRAAARVRRLQSSREKGISGIIAAPVAVVHQAIGVVLVP